MKLADAVQVWYKKKAREWTPKVSADVARFVRAWLACWGEEMEVGSLSVADVERLESQLVETGISECRLNTIRTYLRQFLNYCRELEWGPVKDPTKLWKWRKYVLRRRYAPLSREEEERLCAVAPEWLRRYVRIAVGTGQREGTIRQLTWEMVREEEGGWVLEIPAGIMKQRDPHRVPLAPKVREALGERGKGLLIPDLPKETTLWGAFKRYGRKAGINPQSTPHDCKRSFVQRLSRAGIPLQRIMVLLGNKSPGVMLKHYASEVPMNEAEETLLLV